MRRTPSLGLGLRNDIMKFNIATLLGLFALIAFWLGLIVGWIINVIWLFKAGETDAEFWVALVGAFVAPLGAIHGWITIF